MRRRPHARGVAQVAERHRPERRERCEVDVPREDVRARLPDILGKALALIWIDREFADLFSRDPQGTLEREGIVLPENMAIEFQKPGTDRPRVVVYEKRPNSNFKLRVLYLQLVMMAGR